jgi:hypothetical protein
MHRPFFASSPALIFAHTRASHSSNGSSSANSTYPTYMRMLQTLSGDPMRHNRWRNDGASLQSRSIEMTGSNCSMAILDCAFEDDCDRLSFPMSFRIEIATLHRFRSLLAVALFSRRHGKSAWYQDPDSIHRRMEFMTAKRCTDTISNTVESFHSELMG